MSADWREGQYDLDNADRCARGRLAELCRYGNIWDNACDIVDDLLSEEHIDLLLEAAAEAGVLRRVVSDTLLVEAWCQP